MRLSQELLDETPGHLPKHDVKTLRARSLVVKSWIYPARKLLFSSIVLSSSFHFFWNKRISANKTELPGHVRSLHYWVPNPNFMPLSSPRRPANLFSSTSNPDPIWNSHRSGLLPAGQAILSISSHPVIPIHRGSLSPVEFIHHAHRFLLPQPQRSRNS